MHSFFQFLWRSGSSLPSFWWYLASSLAGYILLRIGAPNAILVVSALAIAMWGILYYARGFSRLRATGSWIRSGMLYVIMAILPAIFGFNIFGSLMLHIWRT